MLGSREYHQQSIDRGLSFLPESDRQRLKDAQYFQDILHGGPADAFMHAMRDATTGETAAQARSRANQFVRDTILKARFLDCHGYHELAMELLGKAIHALQDWTSPMHQGFQPWGGGGFEGVIHSIGERTPNSDQMLSMDLAAMNVFGYFYGTLPMPGGFFK